jgi:hypothetical protein
MLLSDKQYDRIFGSYNTNGGGTWTYVPGSLNDAVDTQSDVTEYLTGQGGALKNQSGRLNALSGNYNSIASGVNDVAIGNLLKYGEVSENDLVGQAVTDNTLSYNKAADAARRNMSRMGINPNSGRFAGMDVDIALTRAAAEAGARNLARIQARNENFSRANTLANLGHKYSSLGLNAANSATSALNGATNAYTAAGNNAERYADNLSRIEKNRIDAENVRRKIMGGK